MENSHNGPGPNENGRQEKPSRVCDEILFDHITQVLEKISSRECVPKKKNKVLGKVIRQYREHFHRIHGTLDSDGAGGDSLYPLYRILLAKNERGAYGFQAPGLACIFIQVLGLNNDSPDGKRLRNFQASSKCNPSEADLSGVIFQMAKERLSSNEDYCRTMLGEIHDALDSLARVRGSVKDKMKQKEQIILLRKLVRKMTPLEVKWLVRILLKDLNLGMSSDAIYVSLHKNAPSISLRIVDLEKLCRMLNDPNVDTSKMGIMLFYPFSSMLATRIDIIDSEFENNNSRFHMEAEDQPSTSKATSKPKVSLPAPPFYVETKWDGDRFQIHYDGAKFKYFSRNAYDYSDNFNDSFTPKLQPLLARNVKSFILDGEMMTFNKELKIFTQKGCGGNDVKAIKMDDPNYCPVYVAFDTLFLNGEILTKAPLKERREKLVALFKAKEDVIRVNQVKVVSTKQEVVDCLNTAIDDGEEGLVVKNMNSPYLPGQRPHDWLKVKAEYLKDHAISDLDLVILGAYFTDSTFHREAGINRFLVGVIDKDTDNNSSRFYPITKLGPGRLNSAAVKEFVKSLMPKFVRSSNPEATATWEKVHFEQEEKPDFVIEPRNSMVVQVKASEIIPSSTYSIGYTLRFPRIVRTREDKSPMEIMTLAEFHTMREAFRGKLAKRSDANEPDGRTCQRKSLATKNQAHPSKRPLPKARGLDRVYEDSEDEDLDENGSRFAKSSSNSGLSTSLFKSKSRSTSSTTTPAETSQKKKIFDKKEFCVYGKSAWKAAMEKRIRQHGGSITENPDVNNLFCIIGEKKESPRTMKAIESGKYDVLPGNESSWLMKCIQEGKLLRLHFKDFWGMKKETKDRLKLESDSCSDSYSMEAVVDADEEINSNGGGGEAEVLCPSSSFSIVTPSVSSNSAGNSKKAALPTTNVSSGKRKFGIWTFQDDDDDDEHKTVVKDGNEEEPTRSPKSLKVVAVTDEEDDDDESTDFSDSELHPNIPSHSDECQQNSDDNSTDFSDSEALKIAVGEGDIMDNNDQDSKKDDLGPPSPFMSDVAAFFRGTINPEIKSRFKHSGGKELESENDENITHVIVCNEGNPSKQNHSRAHVVYQKWLENSLRNGKALDEWDYLVRCCF